MNFDEIIKKRPIFWLFSSCGAVVTAMFLLMKYVNSSHTEALTEKNNYLKPFEDKYESLKKENEIIKAENNELKFKNNNIKFELEKTSKLLEERESENAKLINDYKSLEKDYLLVKDNQKIIKNRPKTKNDLIAEQIKKLEQKKKGCSIIWIEPLDISDKGKYV
ncbi:hypothetical protein [Rodentibacter sp. Ppn85]|uniref:hypothetical protein n=1 Tax=Rodentibacter sp. Ppn85 TaxID=1908525 RepID=UPI0009846505|nr:hypothetical protein [Rodentibacter sp. Ppn85]OOF65844.1 hypothetical protein BKL51_03695 [Rodentibacter sp. Ppn85]